MNFCAFASSTEEHCRTFDLTCRIPPSVVEGALQTGHCICLSVDSHESESELSTVRIIQRIEDILNAESETSSRPLRICIPSLGSPQWGDLNSQVHSTQILQVAFRLQKSQGDIMVFVLIATAPSPIPACVCQFISVSIYLHRSVGRSWLDPQTRVVFRWGYNPISIYRYATLLIVVYLASG